MNQNARYIMEERYLWTDPATGVKETPEDLFSRVATTVAAVEVTQELQSHYTSRFYSIMNDLYFLPNTPALMNAGRPLGQLFACFVIPVEDSMEGIFDAVKYGAIIHKSGGGTGYSFSRLRESNAIVSTTGKVASGPVVFMRTFDTATETVKQGGVRRGANMAILRVDHPDIFSFIAAKKEPGAFTNFNFSVAVTDKFMEALEQDQFFDLVSPLTGDVIRSVKASEIMTAIIDGAWASGEPGVIFIDTINKANPLPHLGDMEATNPCGEQPLHPYESCVLGSINLGRHVKDGAVDLTLLEENTRLAVRFLDNCIDASSMPLPEIEEATKANRKIGLGVMGWADLLLLLGIKYNSEEALDAVDQIMGSIYQWADDESRQLAKEKGPFPNAHLAEEGFRGRRNATVTTIAPTGTISILAGASSGIEPLFGYAQVSQRKIVKEILFEITYPVKQYCEEQEIDLSKFKPSKKNMDSARNEVDRLNTYLRGVLPEYFTISQDISPDWHVKMQARFQRYVENAVSKTINLPNAATRKDVEQAYLMGYRMGVKGLTVYRDGSREEQVIYTQAKKPSSIVRPRPDVLDGKIFRIKTERGDTTYITVGLDENGNPFEIFNYSVEGMERPYEVESIYRLVSLGLRAGISVAEICRQLDKATRRGHLYTTPAQVKRILMEAAGLNVDEGICPHCAGVIKREGGCLSCPCGKSSKCE